MEMRKLPKWHHIHQKIHIQNAPNIQTRERFVIRLPSVIMRVLKDVVNLKIIQHLAMIQRKNVILMRIIKDVVNMVIIH